MGTKFMKRFMKMCIEYTLFFRLSTGNFKKMKNLVESRYRKAA